MLLGASISGRAENSPALFISLKRFVSALKKLKASQEGKGCKEDGIPL